MEYKPYNIGRTTYWCAAHRVLLEKHQECLSCLDPSHQAQITAQLSARWIREEHAFFLRQNRPQRRQPQIVRPEDKPNFTNPWCQSLGRSPLPHVAPKDNKPRFTNPWCRLIGERLKKGTSPQCRVRKPKALIWQKRRKVIFGRARQRQRQLDKIRLEELCGLKVDKTVGEFGK
ncbi:hypothetical protein MBLNU457_g0854t1 [Dothideomycetes sp. NU457]